MSCIGFASASEINVKLGADLVNALYSDEKHSSGVEQSVSERYKAGFSVSGEYLYLVSNVLKVGGGIEYLFAREKQEGQLSFSFGSRDYSALPVFITLQLNPVENGFFIKGNFGYVASFGIDYKTFFRMDMGSGDVFETYEEISDEKGGIYYGLAVGYEFSAGLIIETSFDCYNGKSTYKQSNFEYSNDVLVQQSKHKADIDNSFYRAGIKIGYKFKL